MFFLTRTRSKPDDRGSALIAVIAIMAVVMIVSVALASATLSSLQYTSATRAGVQAQSAAEAGIDYAAVKLDKACTAQYNQTSPRFEVLVSYLPVTGGVFTAGCPAPGAVSIKLRSTGHPDVDVRGNETGNSRTVEAIYAAPSKPVSQTWPAIYAYTSSGFAGPGAVAEGPDGPPVVSIRHGNVACTGGGGLAGDLTVADGDLSMIGSCKVDGNVWASGSLTMSSATAGGDATAKSIAMNSSQIGRNAWASGAMSLTWGSSVGGNATAAVLGLDGGNVKGSAWAAGAATFINSGAYIDGFLTAKSSNYAANARGGSKIVAAGPGAGPAAGPTPSVPDWVDFKYDKKDWVGFNVAVIKGACNFEALKTAAAGLASGPGIIDALGCDNALTIDNGNKLAVGNQLAIIAKGFSLNGGGFTATAKRELWLITPDSVADAKPTCPGSAPAVSDFTVANGFTFDAKVSTMIYSPCKVTMAGGIVMSGHVFSGNTTIDNGAKLTFVKVGLPGVGLSDGAATPSGGPGVLGVRTSIRDING